MDRATFITLVEEILEVDDGSVSFESSLDALDWDSLCNITFIAEVDTAVGKTVAADDLLKASTVADLYELVSPGNE